MKSTIIVLRLIFYTGSGVVLMWLMFTHRPPDTMAFFDRHGIDPLPWKEIISLIVFALWLALPLFIALRGKAPMLAGVAFWVLGFFAIAFSQEVSSAQAARLGDYEHAIGDTGAGAWLMIGWFPAIFIWVLGRTYGIRRKVSQPPAPANGAERRS